MEVHQATPSIKLKSSDGVVFDVDIEAAKMSETLKTMLELVSSDPDEIVSITRVDSHIMKLVIDWCEHHKKDLPHSSPNDECKQQLLLDREDELELPTNDMDDWDAKFIDLSVETKFELITAANFLEIKDLVELAAKSIANLIKGKTVEELRQTFCVSVLDNVDDELPEEIDSS